jgi:hypothetical protein
VGKPLRLLIYDRTCPGRGLRPGLSRAWHLGHGLYRALGRLDDACAAATWAEALDWLLERSSAERIAEVQFWGHGQWGQVLIGTERLDAGALVRGHELHARLARLRGRMEPGDGGLWWFRSCETFGGARGQAFARAWTAFFGCRAAGHTHVIGVWQSGLHALRPGEAPTWPADEGLPPGDPAPRVALPSRPGAPNTISFLQGRIPAGF